MTRILLAANWKMQGSANLLKEFATAFATLSIPPHLEVILCLPYVYLPLARQLLEKTPVKWGAQDVSAYLPGPYTGQISAQMLHEFGCNYGIIGHSERRIICGESNNLIVEKFAQLKAMNILPILCVGETDAERDAGQTIPVVLKQISSIIEQIGIAAFANSVIAYEPVWAIGTGKAATPEDVRIVHEEINHFFVQHNANIAATIRIIYGGSMNENNVKSLLSLPFVAGGLVGGASLKLAAFKEMIMAVG